MPSNIQTAAPVTVTLQDLQAGTVPLSTLVAAFGPDSLGILVVTNLPSSFVALRAKVLRNSSRLAALPAAKLQALTNASAKYLVGWSHGVETLKPGVVDTAKGSYYINCAFYTESSTAGSTSEENGGGGGTVAGFEEYTAPNLWPDDADIPNFRPDAEQLIRLIIDTAVLVARACDRYSEGQIEGYPSGGFLEHVVKTSTTTKARLLHYFPPDAAAAAAATTYNNGNSSSNNNNNNHEDEDNWDNWCATHLDHGCLTGLTSAMFIDESAAEEEKELAASPSPTAGLYIRSRTGQTYKVSIPRDGLAFQTGEALELITRGKFKAVPHFVRGLDPRDLNPNPGPNPNPGSTESGATRKVARNTLAVFTQPNLNEIVDAAHHTTFGEFARGVVKKNTAG